QPIQHECVARQSRRSVRHEVTEISVEERLDAGISRTEAISKQLILLVVVPQEGAGDFESMPVRCALAEGLPECSQFQVDVAEQFLMVFFGTDSMRLNSHESPKPE